MQFSKLLKMVFTFHHLQGGLQDIQEVCPHASEQCSMVLNLSPATKQPFWCFTGRARNQCACAVPWMDVKVGALSADIIWWNPTGFFLWRGGELAKFQIPADFLCQSGYPSKIATWDKKLLWQKRLYRECHMMMTIQKQLWPFFNPQFFGITSWLWASTYIIYK